jgi:hypothetical protein
MCAPSTAACADSTTVEVCNAQGTAVETTYSCPSTCTQGSCQPDLDPTSPNSPDRCTTAPNVGDGILVYAHPDDLTDDVEERLENALQDLQADGKVQHSGRNGGYTLA